MTRTIHRYQVPVDGRWHQIDLTGDLLHVDCRDPAYVEFWAVAGDTVSRRREFRVIGTGHPFPGTARYVDTAIAPGGWPVWHLIEASFPST